MNLNVVFARRDSTIIDLSRDLSQQPKILDGQGKKMFSLREEISQLNEEESK